MVDDALVGAKEHGYVPEGCYLDGFVVMYEKMNQRDPCAGCNLDRNKCGGRPKRQNHWRKQRTSYNNDSTKLSQKPVEINYGRR